jgi:hypothetical protein
MTEITEDDLNGLAAKLDGLDLNDTERVLLDGLMERAAAYEPEVEGFGVDLTSYGSYSGNTSGAGLQASSLKLAGGLGFVTRPSLGYGEFDSNDPTKPPPP